MVQWGNMAALEENPNLINFGRKYLFMEPISGGDKIQSQQN